MASWVAFGLLAGFIASRALNKTGDGFLLDAVIGIVGAIAGAWMFGTFGTNGVSAFNLYSVFVGLSGAVLLMVIYRTYRRIAA